MGLYKSGPTGGLATQRNGIEADAAADVVAGRIADLASEIVLGTDDALADPGRVFLDQFDDEFSSFGSTDGRLIGLLLTKAHFLATRAQNQRGRVTGVTSVASCPRRRRPTSLALRVSRIR